MEKAVDLRYAIVTGSNKGIGFETVRQLALEGIKVVLTSRDEKKGLEAIEKLKASGLSDDKVVFISLMSQILLVNNAGILGIIIDLHAYKLDGVPPKADDVIRETFEATKECLDTNYYGAKRMVDAFVPLLQLSDSPRIVNISSSSRLLKGATPDTNDVHPPARSPEPEQVSEQVQPEVQLRRSTRERQPSRKYSPNEYVMLTDGGEPESYDEAIIDQHKTEWLKAMQEEMKSLHENHTFDLVKLPQGRKALKNKWVYKIKSEEGNLQPRYKARLVVKGFGQKKGVDFEEIFSPVVKMSSIRVVLGLAASLNLEVEQLDVKTAFLHGDLDEEIYMEQPESFQVKGKEKSVCRLKNSLYGLKQAPRQWYKKFDSFMEKNKYNRTTADHCVFIKKFSDGDFIILLLYVDDMLIVGQDIGKINRLKKELSKSFAMKDLGPVKQILGMRITRNRQN
ncbi:hypothetical protein ACOSQ3_022150 [Xanthoceras sorbifolium]